MILGSQTVWASSLWTHLLTQGRKDLHISSTTCCGVREKCGTTLEMEPKKVGAPYEIERDIYIVLSLVLVWLWALYMNRPLPFIKVLRVPTDPTPNAKEMTKTKVLLISEKQWKTKTTKMKTLTKNSNLLKINLRSFTMTTLILMPYFTWRIKLLTTKEWKVRNDTKLSKKVAKMAHQCVPSQLLHTLSILKSPHPKASSVETIASLSFVDCCEFSVYVFTVKM